MASFLDCLKEGRSAERYVADLLRECGVETEECDTVEMDIRCRVGSARFSVEVKYDKLASVTGNLAVEYWNSRSQKPSGINATEAEFWVFVLPDPLTAMIARTDDLRAFIAKHKPDRRVYGAGDGNARLYLYAMERLSRVFFSLSEANKYEREDIFWDFVCGQVQESSLCI